MRIVEKQKLLNTTQSTGMPSSTAVASAPTADSSPPSPTRQTTFRCGAPIFAPIAAPGAKPIVAMPPLVMNAPRLRDVKLLAGAVLVPADIGHEDRVIGHDLSRSRAAAVRGESACRCPAGCRSAVPPRRSVRRASAAMRRLAVASRTQAREDGRVSSRAWPGRRRPARPRPDRSCRFPAARCRSESARDGGMAKVKRGFQELQSASPKAVPIASTTSACVVAVVGGRGAPDPGHAECQRMTSPETRPCPSASWRRECCSSSASSRSSPVASDSSTPLPAKTTGRSRRPADAPHRRCRRRGATTRP